MTGEAKGPTEKWIKEKGAKFAYAYEKSGKFARLAGVSGIPHVMIVGANGKVVYNGGAGAYSDDVLKQAMAGAVKKPLWELPKEFAKARGAFAKGDFAAALKECDGLTANTKVAADAETLRTTITGIIEARLAGSKAAADAGDWASAKDGYEKLAKGAVGLPAEISAKEALAEIAKNADAQKALKAQKALAAVMAMPDEKAKDKEAKVSSLADFVKKNPDSYAGKKAQEALDALRAAKPG